MERGDVAAFVEKVARTARSYRMLEAPRVLTAVSGGADSLALLHALHRLAPSFGYELSAVHVDHRLRRGSGTDAAFVARVCSDLSVPFHVFRLRSEDLIGGLGPEAGARQARYRCFERALEEVGGGVVATGHTSDDQAETVMLHLLRGGGLDGLAGIPPVRAPFVRPLIDLSRADTVGFCAALGLVPRRDPTNADPRYLRNFLRSRVLPVLEAERPGAIDRLARVAALAREDLEVLDALAAKAFEEAAGRGAETSKKRRRDLGVDMRGETGGGREVRLAVEFLAALPLATRRRVVRLGLRTIRGSLEGIGSTHVEAVLALLASASPSAETHLPGALLARRSYGLLILAFDPGAARFIPPIRLAVPGSTDLVDAGLRVDAWFAKGRPRKFIADGRHAALDAGRLEGELEVRGWRTGDRYRPLGMSGTKKVSDLLSDAKVPRADRVGVPVVTAAGRIVWVVGFPPADDCRVEPNTTKTLWLAVGSIEEEA